MHLGTLQACVPCLYCLHKASSRLLHIGSQLVLLVTSLLIQYRLHVQSVKQAAQPDELIDFSHLKARKGLTQLELEDEVASDLQRATGLADADSADASRLSRVLQLSGEWLLMDRTSQCACCYDCVKLWGSWQISTGAMPVACLQSCTICEQKQASYAGDSGPLHKVPVSSVSLQ